MNKKAARLAVAMALLLVTSIVLSIFKPDRGVPPTDVALDMLHNQDGEAPMALRKACYDCHSYETQYPGYASFGPVAWWINSHIRNGRKKVNFSTWGDYSQEDRIHIIKECIEEIRDGHMPPKSYKWMHAEAKWDEALTNEVVAFLEGELRMRGTKDAKN